MLVGIVDADLIGRKDHRFPNLVCMKLSAYWKDQGAEVQLLMDYNTIQEYDKVFVSKVFTDTPLPDAIMGMRNVTVGGTGFFFDKAPALLDDIEHHMPDYSLYDDYLVCKAHTALNYDFKKFVTKYDAYLDFSIGFLTRGCFRHCPFCVNRGKRRSNRHSPLREFFDTSRKKLCFMDDNFFAYIRWRELLDEVLDTERPFFFKQGLDVRLLDEDKCSALFASNYAGDFIFAFDFVEDYDEIADKLKLIRRFYSGGKAIKFYLLAGYSGVGVDDLSGLLRRIKLLFKYGALPYVMLYRGPDGTPYKTHPLSGLYTALARWCNQPSMVKKMSFREFCHANQEGLKTGEGATMRALRSFEQEYPAIAQEYFDMRFQPWT